MNKKIVVLGVLGVLLLSSFSVFVTAEKQNSSEEISMSYLFETPVIENVEIGNSVYDRVKISDAPLGGNPGEPRLPYRGAYILLPHGTKVSSITVDPGEMVCLGSGYKVEPVGEVVPLSDIDSAPLPAPDETIYSSNNMFPSRFFTEVGTYSYRGYKILVGKLHPVQYVPASGELFYFPDLSVSVEIVKDDSINCMFRGLENDRLEIMDKVENPVMTSSYALNTQQQRTVPGQSTPITYDLLIITSEALKDGFLPLKQAHEDDGLSTLIYTVENIYNSFSGVDDADKIRNFIKYAYNNYGTEYVLLGGDSDIVPARLLWVGVDGSVPADLYFGCLDGTFNYDGDDEWGEPTDGENDSDVDLIAEVYVGRACVGNSSEVQNFVDKTISYMNIEEDDEYLKKALFVGEHLGFGGRAEWGGTHLNELIGKCIKHFYTTQGFPKNRFDIDKLYERNEDWSKSDLINRINQGVYVINHLGHSNYWVTMKLYFSDMNLLTNDKYCFIYSQGCKAGGFDNPGGYDSIAEHFTVKTSHGAFAGIWNSRSGRGRRYSTDSPSHRYHREYWDAVFGENITVISKANQDSKEDNAYRINEVGMRWCYYQLNLFGDPTLNFPTHFGNTKPNKPETPHGPNSGEVGTEYDYTTCTTDPDGHNIKYGWDWQGDFIVDEWTDFYTSGTPVTVSHSWSLPGPRWIRVKAKDFFGTESTWSDSLKIILPNNYNSPRSQSNGQQFTNPLFLKLLERFPNSFPIFRYLLGL